MCTWTCVNIVHHTPAADDRVYTPVDTLCTPIDTYVCVDACADVCVCARCSTFANNQHHLDELAGSVTETPFYKAIASESCCGIVALMDEDCTPFTRIW